MKNQLTECSPNNLLKSNSCDLKIVPSPNIAEVLAENDFNSMDTLARIAVQWTTPSMSIVTIDKMKEQ